MAIPSDECLLAFGRIVFWYAQVEFGIKSTVAGILDLHIHDMQILAEPYSALSLRNVAKSIVKSSDIDSSEQAEFVHIIGEFKAAGPLRNAVAHNMWTDGTRAGSIKPTRMEIRSGHAQSIGWDINEADYTETDFSQAVTRLIAVNDRLRRFQLDTGIAARIVEKMEAASPSTDDSEGNSNSPS